MDNTPEFQRPQGAFFSRSDASNGRPLRRLAIISVYTVLATALLVFGVVFWSASRIDELSRERQSRTVASALAESIQKIPYDQESVAIWDDAVLKLREPYDVKWVEANLGVWMYTYFQHDRIYIVAGLSDRVMDQWKKK